MFETVKRLYNERKLNELGVRNAVQIGWITQEQYYDITGIVYE